MTSKNSNLFSILFASVQESIQISTKVAGKCVESITDVGKYNDLSRSLDNMFTNTIDSLENLNNNSCDKLKSLNSQVAMDLIHVVQDLSELTFDQSKEVVNSALEVTKACNLPSRMREQFDKKTSIEDSNG